MGYKVMYALKDLKDGKPPPPDPTILGLTSATRRTSRPASAAGSDWNIFSPLFNPFQWQVDTEPAEMRRDQLGQRPSGVGGGMKLRSSDGCALASP